MRSKSKSIQKGGECGNFTIVGEIAPGIPKYGLFQGADCQAGGVRSKSQLKSKKAKTMKIRLRLKHKSKSKSSNNSKKIQKIQKTQKTQKTQVKSKKVKRVVDDKKVEAIIEKLCESIKRKCTPKYKKILKELVVKHM